MSLVERDDELACLDDLYTETRSGRGRVVHITGAVACGKSSLLHDFSNRVTDQGGLHLHAVASSAEEMLPFGVIGQLVSGESGDLESEVGPLLKEGASLVQADSGLPHTDRALRVIKHDLALALLKFSTNRSLLISIDDVEHTDAASMQCLSFLVRRIRSVPMMLVLVEGAAAHAARPPLHLELLRQPDYHRLSLRRISRAGTARLLSGRLNFDLDEAFITECYSLTAGNPLLIDAVVADTLKCADRGSSTRPATGEHLDRAVAECLYRMDSDTRRYAETLAVLDRCVGVVSPGRLCGMLPETASRALRNLHDAGLVKGNRFRHPSIALSVLRATRPEDRAAMRSGLARLLYQHGASDLSIARELIAGEENPEWAVEVLIAASEQVAASGDNDTALTYLDHADRLCGPDERMQSAILSVLARISWRTDPRLAMRHSNRLIHACAQGWLSGASAIDPVLQLLWAGRVDDAIQLMDRLELEGTYNSDAAATQALVIARLWCNYIFPHRRGDAYRPEIESAPGSAVTLVEVDSTLLLRALCDRDVGNQTVTLAEHLLQDTHLADAMLPPILAALFTLVFTDHDSDALPYCDSLLAEAIERNASTWVALLKSVRAELFLRRGELERAQEDVTAALQLLHPEGWGVLIGFPVGTLLRVAVASGNGDLAGEYLNLPLPDRMVESVAGVHYLHARSAYFVASGRFEAALIDLTTCETIVKSVGIDSYWALLWRIEMARACLGLGDAVQARRLATEQLGMLDPAQSRMRGMTIRILAAASDVDARPALLSEAVDLLRESGDWLELAHAFEDLGRALQVLGDREKAADMLQSARQLLRECHEGQVRAPGRHRPPQSVRDHDQSTEQVAAVASVKRSPKLSSAELRVATLAARGYTNREISKKLFITPSTVEQHLTRIYRKLNVRGRSDLSPTLDIDIAKPA